MNQNTQDSFGQFDLLNGMPGLYDQKNGMTTIADIHLGLEGTATLDGNYVPPVQFSQTKTDLQKAQEQTNSSKILVNGDIKNQFSGTRFTESKEVEDFLRFCEDNFAETILVRGNHDNFLDESLDRFNLQLRDRYMSQKTLYVHGHNQINPSDSVETIVIGHEHPALELEDEVGVTEKIRCLLHGKTKNGREIVVLPAFAKASNGTEINNTPKSELLSPVLKNRVNINSLTPVSMERDAPHLKFPSLGKLR